jgi:uncharacterized protein YdhG (YjbR/CyaY superfamily)
MKKPVTIDEYIAGYPKETQKILQQMRTTIKSVAPQAEEVISYGMPAFKLHGMLAWFAAHTHHTGLYPGASTMAAFKKEVSAYKNAKGSVQFPFDKPLPLGLIKKMVQFKATENSLRVQKPKKQTR